MFNKKSKKIPADSDFDFVLWFDARSTNITKRKVDSINEFFKRVMFENPHLILAEKKAKQEARSIFAKEIVKNMTDSNGSKYPNWP